jgi:lipoate-protein ligase B
MWSSVSTENDNTVRGLSMNRDLQPDKFEDINPCVINSTVQSLSWTVGT